MDEDQRTLWCGNLSDKVTEDVLYELFLQGGPIQKVSIPKDRDGKQRTYGFVTFKHVISVPYALDLFDGTSLFDRTLSMKKRNVEPQAQQQQQQQHLYYNNGMRHQEPVQDMNMYNLRDRMIIGSLMGAGVSMCGLFPGQDMLMVPNHPLGAWPNQEERRPPRGHPYQRDRDRDRDRDRERHDYKDRNDHRDRHSSHRSNDYSRNSDHRNHRRNYRH